MNELVPTTDAEPIPAFTGGQNVGDLRQAITQAVAAWLLRTPSPHTRKAYEHDVRQFLAAGGIASARSLGSGLGTDNIIR